MDAKWENTLHRRMLFKTLEHRNRLSIEDINQAMDRLVEYLVK